MSENKKKTSRKMPTLCSILILICVAFYFISAFYLRGVCKDKYNRAIEAMNEGNYAESLQLLNELGESYKDVSEIIEPVSNGAKYQEATSYYEEKEYEEAIKLFEELADSNYNDSKEKLYEVKYTQAVEYYDSSRYKDALPIFIELGYYEDSNEYYEKCVLEDAGSVAGWYYLEGAAAYDRGDFEKALKNFYAIRHYKNSEEFIAACEKRLNITSSED